MPEDLYLPTVWFEGFAHMSKESAQRLKSLLDMPRLVTVIGSVLVVICLAGAVFAVTLKCITNSKTNETKVDELPEDQQGCEETLLPTQN